MVETKYSEIEVSNPVRRQVGRQSQEGELRASVAYQPTQGKHPFL